MAKKILQLKIWQLSPKWFWWSW